MLDTEAVPVMGVTVHVNNGVAITLSHKSYAVAVIYVLLPACTLTVLGLNNNDVTYVSG
jgi:hypothetical protein